jgi:hypothetical protein
MLNGDPQSGLLMHIIRFVMPSKSKPLKKLMYLFLEVCPKHDAQGKLRQEWILVWCVYTRDLLELRTLTWEKQCYSVRFAGTKRIRARKHVALCVGPPYAGILDTANGYDRTKLRDAELVEPLLREFGQGCYMSQPMD